MPKMSSYCKAYYVSSFREFGELAEYLKSPIGKEATEEGGQDEGGGQLSDTDVLCPHDNFILTRGVFVDEDISFAKSRPGGSHSASRRSAFNRRKIFNHNPQSRDNIRYKTRGASRVSD